MISSGPNSQKKNKNLRNFWFCLTLTIGTSFLNDFKRAQISKKKTWETSEIYDPDHRKMIFTWFPEGPISTEKQLEKLLRYFSNFWTGNPQNSDPPGVPNPRSIANFIYFLCCGPWVLTSSLLLGHPAKEIQKAITLLHDHRHKQQKPRGKQDTPWRSEIDNYLKGRLRR